MTGVTEIVRACRIHYWRGRLGLLQLLALLPRPLQPIAETLVLGSAREGHALEDPMGPMPMPRLDMFLEHQAPLPAPAEPARLAAASGLTRARNPVHLPRHVDAGAAARRGGGALSAVRLVRDRNAAPRCMSGLARSAGALCATVCCPWMPLSVSTCRPEAHSRLVASSLSWLMGASCGKTRAWHSCFCVQICCVEV